MKHVTKIIAFLFPTLLLPLSPPLLAAVDKPITNWTSDDLLKAKEDWQQQGFKLHLSEFALSNASPAQLRAASIITTAGLLLQLRGPVLMQTVSPTESLVMLSQAHIPAPFEGDLWTFLGKSLQTKAPLLAQAQSAALETPLRFNLHPRKGHLLLPHLGWINRYAVALSFAAISDLHQRRQAEASTNLLALTTLISRWEVEPLEVSHMVRVAMLRVLYATLWEAVAYTNWTDGYLLQHQDLLAGLDLFSNLPEAIALDRALTIERLSATREELKGELSISDNLEEAVSKPSSAFSILKEGFAYRDRIRNWINHWSFVEEASLLQHFVDQEKALSTAMQKSTWLEMRPIWLPAVTNEVPELPEFRMAGLLSIKRITLGVTMLADGSAGGGFLGAILHAEAHRRILMTALAVERYRLNHGSLPPALSDLVPDFLSSIPLDPVDGQPLRYSVSQDQQYIIYSIGLDAEDNSGTQLYHHLPISQRNRAHDILWPKRVLHPSSAR